MNGYKPDIAIIDADSMIYRTCYKYPDGTKAIEVLDNTISGLINKLEASEAFILFKGTGNFRYEVDINYKASRSGAIPEDLRNRVDKLYEYAVNHYGGCDGAEADDYAGILNKKYIEEGRLPIIAHIDKDLNMLAGWHYNYGNKPGMYFVDADEAYVFLMKQLLTGDASDSIQGIKGVGPVKASKLLDYKYNHEMLDIVQEQWKKQEGRNWKKAFTKVCNLIWIRDEEQYLRPLEYDEIIDILRWEGESNRYREDLDSKVNLLNVSDVEPEIIAETEHTTDVVKVYEENRRKRSLGVAKKDKS